MPRRLYLYIILISILSGCTLDDINRYGDQCPPDGEDGELSYILTPDCNAETCLFGDFTQNFASKRCPLEYSKCAKDENGRNYCATIACSEDEHVHNGQCQPNDLQNCGRHHYDCAQSIDGWKDGTCEAGSCEPSACVDDYKLSNGRCVPLKGCPTGEHINDSTNACEPDTLESCGKPDNDCTSLKGWISGACVHGKCVATECNESDGYILNDDTCSPQLTCDPNQHFYNKKCEDNDVNNCGGHGIVCAYNISGWKSGTCETVNTFTECITDTDCFSGFCVENECHVTECVAQECDDIYDIDNGKCVPRSTCPSGKHLYQNYCEEDDTDNCGDHNHQCRNVIEGWKTGNCENSQCVPESCRIGYHLKDGLCELDTADACGEPAIPCGSKQLCSNGECKDNCDAGSIRCVSPESVVSCADPLSSNTYCGADSTCTNYISCQNGQTCIEGSCIQTSCPDDDKTLCTIEGQPQCIDIHANDPTNCGDCNHKCDEYAPAHATSQGCSSGICQYECESGYKNCSVTETPKCMEEASFASDPKNCGDCGIQCNESDEYCKGGHCLKSTCSNSCLDNGNCINTDTHCGTNCTNCNTANDAAQGTCESGSCKIKKCRENYHLSGNACVTNTATSCAPVDSSTVKNCMTENNASSGQCVSGQCVATDCKSGYHLSEGKCVKDTATACGKSPQDCTKLSGWSDGTCQNGTCKASKCKSGFCLNGSTCVDGSSNASTCGTNGQTCKACDNHFSCQSGTCKLSECDANICFYNGTECSNTNTHCGTNCTNCNTNGNATAGTCNNGVCIITSCKSGYHVYNNTCEQDSVDHCGAHNYKCSDKDPGWSGGTCTGGTCKATSCKGGYHLYNNACEVDSLSNCGSHDYTCSVKVAGWSNGSCTSGQCKATSCTSTYHVYNNSCEAESNTHCGTHNNTCQSPETCQSKVCKCPNGYYNTTYNNNSIRAACISSVQDFMNFRTAINAGNTWPADNTANAYFLTRDIDLGTQNSWTGVGTSSKKFQGKFLGNNKTISGTLNCSENNCGIFGYMDGYSTNAVITDLRSSAKVTSTADYVGGIIGSIQYARLNNLTSSGAISGRKYVGGIVGNVGPSTISNCTSSSNVSASDKDAGGIAGSLAVTSLGNCRTTGTITAANGNVGGIVGSTTMGVSISNSQSSGNVRASTAGYAGGIVGYGYQGGMTDCSSTSYVATGSIGGGLAGYAETFNITTSYHIGTVSTGGTAGGLVGEISGGNLTISKSGAFGTVSNTASGGLVGSINSNAKSIKILNCFSVVDLYGAYMGGLIGNSNAPADTTNSELSCTWNGALFKNQPVSAGAVSNGEKTFSTKGPNYVYNPTYTSAYNKDYASGFTLSNNIPMSGATAVYTILSGTCSSGSWTNKSCTISNGLAGAGTYTLPMPGITPSICQ